MANSEALNNGDSIPAATTFAVIFALLTVANTFRLIRCRAWFCIPFIIGGIMETTGYITRALSSSNPTSTPLKIIQVLCILLAPVLFAASIYMLLGRIIRATHGERYSPLRSTWITKTFVLGDITCFIVQAIGAGVIAAGASKNVGGNIVLGGLILQIVAFGVFAGVGGAFHVVFRRMLGRQGRVLNWKWEGHMGMLYVMSGLIGVRNIFRVVEYCMGVDGYLMNHEWPLYVFDAATMSMVLSFSLFSYGLSRVRGEDRLVKDIELDEDENEDSSLRRGMGNILAKMPLIR
ncbi:hypothetical protein PMZ80_010325 [Knufia obscura]|uniref:RTA1-domain-containing protein n=1 Tax=Knufia obscura TaxID=1635080 RepID=A0ABR0R9M0_9EURO|nr:hypothetical protein PMZ80_010325 [Knufia obscura]